MLHREALPTGTLDLLTALSSNPALASFALAGGTSLALRFGHRLSVDLDFFTTDHFDKEPVIDALKQTHRVSVQNVNPAGLRAIVDDVNVDFVTYRYALLAPPETISGIRLLSLADVVGMKLSAVTNRGAKKDFYDLYTLIKELGMAELLRIYQAKYPGHDPLIMLRSISYFADAEGQDDPKSLIGITWPQVKRSIERAVKTALK
jgi:predicted nucleotidyltransferase component of viral defense system